MSFEGITQIGQIAIPVHDLETAVEFYQDSLGMEFLFQVPNMAFFDCGRIRILLAVPEEGNSDQRSSIIYFKVADIHAATDALRDRDVVITSDPHLIAEMNDHDLWMSFFLDPDDNMLALMSEVPKSAALEQTVEPLASRIKGQLLEKQPVVKVMADESLKSLTDCVTSAGAGGQNPIRARKGWA